MPRRGRLLHFPPHAPFVPGKGMPTPGPAKGTRLPLRPPSGTSREPAGMRAFGKKTELQRDNVECKYQLNMHCHMPAPSRSVRRQGEPGRSCRSKELELARACGSSPAAPAGAGAIARLTTGAAKPPVQAMAAQNASFSLQAQRRAGSRALQGWRKEHKPNPSHHKPSCTNRPAPTKPRQTRS